MFKRLIQFSLMLIFIISCTKKVEDSFVWKTIEVKATAYNSLAYQTSSQPNIAAWGDSLKPGMKCIAVSKDLFKSGLTHNTEVKLEGFDSIFLVKDRMHYRWKKRIDIYMGVDVKKAKEWGIRTLKLSYKVPKDSLDIN